MNLYLAGAGALAFVAIVGGVGYKAEQYGAAQVREQWNEDRREWQRQTEALRRQKDGVMDAAATKKERLRNEKRPVYQDIDRSITKYVDRPVYLRDCIDSDGLRDINDALAGRRQPESAGQPAATVPAAGAAGRDLGR